MDRDSEIKNDSDKEGRSRSSTGEFSTDSSTVGVSPFKNETLVLMPELVTSEDGAQLRIIVRMAKSTIRHPVTHITGKSEGDHVTAYVAILELLCVAIEGEDADDIPGRMVEIIKCVFDSEEIKQKFDKQLNDFQQFAAQHFQRSDRKKLTQNNRKLVKAFQKFQAFQKKYQKELSMRPIISELSNVFPNDLIMTTNNLYSDRSLEKQKRTLKRGEISLPMEAIQKIGNAFLAKIQSLHDVAFSKPEHQKSDKSTDGEVKEDRVRDLKTEGNRVQRGLYGLTALNRLLKVRRDIATIQAAEEKKEDNEYIESKKESVLAFVQDLVESGSKIATGLRIFVKRFVTAEALEKHQCQRHKTCQTNEGKRDHIVEETFDNQFLISFDAEKSYKEQEQRILALYDFIMETTTQDMQLLGCSNLVAQIIGHLFEDLFDFRFSVHGNTDSPANTLAKVTARHIVIMFTAFNQLKHLSSESRELIMSSFIKHGVLQVEGWCDFTPVPLDGKEEDGYLNTETLMNMLREVAILGDKDNRFKILTPLEKNQEELPAAAVKIDKSAIRYSLTHNL